MKYLVVEEVEHKRALCPVGPLPSHVRRSWENPEFRRLAAITALALVLGTLFYWRVEGWSVLDSIYFSVITLTTVGYGDLAPTTAAGKVFTIFCGFAGIGIILGFFYIVAKDAIRRREGT
jgi:voltage-gated potassium channel